MAIGACGITILVNPAKICGLLKVLAGRCEIYRHRAVIVEDALIAAKAALLADVFPGIFVRTIDAEYFERIAHALIISAGALACEAKGRTPQ